MVLLLALHNQQYMNIITLSQIIHKIKMHKFRMSFSHVNLSHYFFIDPLFLLFPCSNLAIFVRLILIIHMVFFVSLILNCFIDTQFSLSFLKPYSQMIEILSNFPNSPTLPRGLLFRCPWSESSSCSLRSTRDLLTS